jgi:hypothetical protein
MTTSAPLSFGRRWSRPTIDDSLIFARMLLGKGKHNDVQALSAASVEAMTTDQLVPSQKVDDSLPDFWAPNGWDFGFAIITQPDTCRPCRGATAGSVASVPIGSPTQAGISSEPF